MANQTRRHASKTMSRRERRAAGIRPTYTPMATNSTLPRRSYMAEPQPIDYSAEYRFVRNDLFRILVWASLLIGAMVVLSFLSIF